MIDSPSFIRRLADLLAADPLREKLLLAPSLRVGRQWLDLAAALAGGVANARAATMGRLLADLAGDGLRRKGLRIAGREEKIRLVGLTLAEMAARTPDDGYFSRLPAGVDLAEKLLDTLEELESAMVGGAIELSAAVSPPAKARELATLARLYAQAKADRGLAGPSAIRAAALAALAGNRRPPLLVVPASVLEECTPLEWGIYSRWPDGARAKLDEAEDGPKAELSFFAADSVPDEAREILRRLQEAGTPLDRAEVVCVDSAAYAPALCAAGLAAFGGPPEECPMTFNAGLPGAYSRPARLLAAWLDWLEQDLPPEGLARLLDAGLIGEPWRAGDTGPSAAAVAAWVRSLPVDGGLHGYRRRLAAPEAAGDGMAAAAAWLGQWLEEVVPGGEAPAVLAAAERLLAGDAGPDNKLDAYARRALADAIGLWLPHADWPGFDAMTWLGGVVADLRVMGLGPLPGRLHVSDLMGGGHSGREHIFVVGLDDGRFPGAARQDPVLLDRERSGISSGLFRSPRRREAREKGLRRLLARARGTVTLSHARAEAGGSRSLYPAAVFTRLAEEAGKEIAPAGMLPSTPAAGLDRREDWLDMLLAEDAPVVEIPDLAPWYPRLAAGEAAERARAGLDFTAWDGYVPEAGDDWLQGERVLSPSDFETLAKCPLEYFFKKILRVVPPERYQPVPGRWLAGNVRGELLHNLFQDFLNELIASGGEVTEDNLREHGETLRRMLDQALRRELLRTPATDHLAREREEDELRQACDIFLRGELVRQRRGRPLCLEAALGGAGEERPPWSRVEPVALRLESGMGFRLRGRVDRIDRLHGHGGLMILDYKSGRSTDYSTSDPFSKGRTLQPYLYTRMVECALAEAGLPEPVRSFDYFFPMPRDEGRPISYSRDMLREGGERILELLTALLARGTFPFTTETNADKTYDYQPLFGDHRELALRTAAKARHDPVLEAWAELRGVDSR